MSANLTNIPRLNDCDLKEFFLKAIESPRKRYPKIIHQPGDYNNKVFNFLLHDTYMQPHLHPGKEKTEKMYLISGSFNLIFFDNIGKIIKKTLLQRGHQEYVEVPPYTWHTYIMLSEKVVVYETMDGIYDPKTWKKMASWAPAEDKEDALTYHNKLRNNLN